MRIAIMQPYFIPYAGYFRLFAAADLFVIYDCVQFIRRGWIHRNRLLGQSGELDWLTLPLKKAPQDTHIKHLAFMDNSAVEWEDRLRAFPQLFKPSFRDSQLMTILRSLGDNPLNYIVTMLKVACESIHLPCEMAYSSDLNLPITLRGQDRIIAIAQHFGATEYINLAGGRELYDAEAFRHHRIKLSFLSDYVGSYHSILERLINEDPVQIRQEILDQSVLV